MEEVKAGMAAEVVESGKAAAFVRLPGMAPIKAQYIDVDHKPRIAAEFLPPEVTRELQQGSEAPSGGGDDTEEPPKKRQKLKGRHKKRPIEKNPDEKDRICPNVLAERDCPFSGRCRFNHDIQAYISAKPPDISDKCYVFENFGKCPYSFACRYASSHLTSDHKNITNSDIHDLKKDDKRVMNILEKDVQKLLWKKKYNFDRADKAWKAAKKNQFARDEKSQRGGGGSKHSPKSEDVGVKLDNVVRTEELVEGVSEKSRETKEVKMETETGVDIDGSGKSPKIPPQNPTEIISGIHSTENNGSLSTEKESLTANNTGEIREEINNGKPLESTDQCENKAGCDNKTDTEAVSSNPVLDAPSGEGNSDITSAPGLNDVCSDVTSAPGVNDVCSDVTSAPGVNDVCRISADILPTLARDDRKKTIDFRDKLYLAPLTTVGNLPFRRVCKGLGAEITCGEMALCTNLLQGQLSEWALLKRHVSEDIFGIQICGSFPDTMTRCAQIVCDTLNVDFIDINCGCPIDLIFKRGEGSALMGRTSRFETIVRSLTTVIDVPLTVKMRTGIYDEKKIAHTLLPRLRDWGVAMTTIHGRSREQRYTRLADWDYINQCAQVASPMPLFGNGDVLSYEDYVEHRERTGVAGAMLARGALIKPWLFTEIKESRHWDISANERLDLLRDFTHYGLEHWGSDAQGVSITRRFLLEWLSFLYRYIPVGLLERLPQKINEKPPYYFGRNDLETMMASPNCADWIKITELVLGPVPSGFTFLPKHKANAYK